MGNTPTPAALVLINAGISGAQLADELDVTRQAISFQLAGKAAEASPDLLEAIERLGGEALAVRVRDAIDEARRRRLLEGSRP